VNVHLLSLDQKSSEKILEKDKVNYENRARDHTLIRINNFFDIIKRKIVYIFECTNPRVKSLNLFFSRRLSTGDNIGRFPETARVSPGQIKPSKDPLPIWTVFQIAPKQRF